MWNLLRRTRKNQKSGRDVREVGWRSLFQAVAEPFAGAWQQGVKADPETVLSFHAVFSCISLISQDIAKMRLRLMQTDVQGIRREKCNQVNHLIPTRVLVKGGEITCKMLK
ncbi:hypothetical protein M10153_1601 [Escherichia coli]|nr:hypothetical protein M10153_1601 [Escherichia coli]